MNNDKPYICPILGISMIPLTQGKYAIVDTGDYEWLSRWKWYCDKAERTYYAKRRDYENDGKIISMHRIILGLNGNVNLQADHINSNGLDNRRSNLRSCTKAENQRNQQIQLRKKTSRYKGVFFSSLRKKWLSRIKLNQKVMCCGTFTSEAEAAKAYDAKALHLFGEFARLNFPPKQENGI